MEIVSIIIPVYNRADLVRQTLDSIIKQTYTYWECLIVDDGSTDNTTKVVMGYSKKDKRIAVFKRPDTKPKGANACRNIGLDKAKGDYVVFFDSDDLMTPNHLEVKVDAIQHYNSDYVISRTQYFNHTNKLINKYYKFNNLPITAYNYVAQKMNWLTPDACIKSSLAKSIYFNERLQSGQEYNYYSKLVHISVNAQFIDKTLTLRRYHDDSIRSKLKDNYLSNKGKFMASWLTYLDLSQEAEFKSLKIILERCVRLVYESKHILTRNKIRFILEVFRIYKLKGFYFLLMIIGLKLLNKGYWFRVKLIGDYVI